MFHRYMSQKQARKKRNPDLQRPKNPNENVVVVVRVIISKIERATRIAKLSFRHSFCKSTRKGLVVN